MSRRAQPSGRPTCTKLPRTGFLGHVARSHCRHQTQSFFKPISMLFVVCCSLLFVVVCCCLGFILFKNEKIEPTFFSLFKRNLSLFLFFFFFFSCVCSD